MAKEIEGVLMRARAFSGAFEKKKKKKLTRGFLREKIRTL